MNEQIKEMAREMCHLSAECETCQICDERYHGCGEPCYFQCVANEIINHDYRKQREGEWIYHECVSTYDGAKSGYSCSVCNAFVDENIFDLDEFHKTFCGNCGTRMKRR